jgi:predicted nuclease of predicted toxin-antitoxin system
VKLLLDMNLSPEWCVALRHPNWEVHHWTEIGPANAEDQVLIEWAKKNGFALVTQDLDMPQILFATREGSPSVILLRIENSMDPLQQGRVRTAIEQAQTMLLKGCLLIIDNRHIRIRALPIQLS